MLWEKKTPTTKGRGYLYIRTTTYVKDKKLSRKFKQDKSTYKNRGKFSKKVDIYCGKILDVKIVNFISFEDYILNSKKDFLKYKIETDYNTLIKDFSSYLLYILDIDLDSFEEKNQVYFFGSCYFCRQTITYLKSFNYNDRRNLKYEFERFYNRCFDAGVFDEEIIILLFSKLIPIDKDENLEKEISELKETKLIRQRYSYLKQFLKESI